jgi:hypothetical protein
VSAGGPTYRHRLTVTVPVHGNVAAVQWHHDCCDNPLMTWYAADRHVIKRIGSFAATRRPQAPGGAP